MIFRRIAEFIDGDLIAYGMNEGHPMSMNQSVSLLVFSLNLVQIMTWLFLIYFWI